LKPRPVLDCTPPSADYLKDLQPNLSCGAENDNGRRTDESALESSFPRSSLNRIAALLRTAVKKCDLDLNGLNVLTEAATGGYAVTPILAALANASHVYAITRSTRFGTVEDVIEETTALAKFCGVEDRIHIVTEKTKDLISSCDLVTNSGHVRPLDGEFVSWMKASAVISLMYETWEIRPEDIDIEACRRRGIPIAGVNETHPAVDVFSYLPVLAAKQLFDAGIPVLHTRILLLCDNPFEPYLRRGLADMGAEIDSFADLTSVPSTHHQYDAVLVSMTPGKSPAISQAEARLLNDRWPGIVVIQFYGDINRSALAELGVQFWPLKSPPSGHMGVYLTDVGPDVVVRLQTGGLKVGEVLSRGLANASAAERDYVQPFR
jgi:hypothetical protein